MLVVVAATHSSVDSPSCSLVLRRVGCPAWSSGWSLCRCLRVFDLRALMPLLPVRLRFCLLLRWQRCWRGGLVTAATCWFSLSALLLTAFLAVFYIIDGLVYLVFLLFLFLIIEAASTSTVCFVFFVFFITSYIGWHDGAVVSAADSQQVVCSFLGLGPFCLEFACSPSVCVSILRVLRLLPTDQKHACEVSWKL